MFGTFLPPELFFSAGRFPPPVDTFFPLPAGFGGLFTRFPFLIK